jgi:hypothetical protein
LEVVVFRSLVRVICLAGSLAVLVALPMGAQEKSTKETKAASTVPQSAQPPAGMCRVWLENVPAGQQPAPTDCATAIKNRPTNARVVFGTQKEDAEKSTMMPPNRPAASQHRFDTGPGIPNHVNPNLERPNQGPGGVRPVNSTAPVRRPSTDSGAKRRP